MGVSKTSLFSQEQNKIASLAKVLGHPARIAILQHLIEKNICICGDLVEEIGLAQSTISQHLKELKLAGIIKGSIEGSSVCYCINQEKWLDIKNTLNQIFDWKPQSSCC
jgi:DNA-binding transcriptional ArsR family regulator